MRDGKRAPDAIRSMAFPDTEVLVNSTLPRLCAAGLAALGLALAAQPPRPHAEVQFSPKRVIKIPKQADLEVISRPA